MVRYNTGNPIDSNAMKDLSDNSQNLDVLANSKTVLSQADRFGVERKTWHGMERDHEAAQSSRDDQFQSAQSARDAAFDEFLQVSGYQDLGEYAPGIEITAHNQYVTFGGQSYLLKPSIPVPYTTSGEWTGDDFKLIGDDALRQDLANPDKGSAMVARSVVVVNSVSEMMSLLGIKVGSTVQTKGYYTQGDGGGNIYEIVAAGTATDDGGAFINLMGSGLQAKGLFPFGVDSVQFGALSGVDSSNSIQSCVNFCVQNGVSEVVNNIDVTVGNVIANMQEVVFIGSGSFSGAGAYNIRQIRPETSADYPVFGFTGGAIPKLCRGPLLGRAVKVVVVGDSLTTKTPDVNDRNATQYDAIVRAISSANPTVPIDFITRGIGGQSVTQLDGVPSMFPDWYTNTSKPWLDYVADELPDVVVISMGMNGAIANNSPALLLSIVTKIQAIPSAPNIVFCTTPLPTSYDSDPALFSAFGEKAQQETRQAAAGIVRTFCRHYGFPFFDVNRQFNLVRNGFDIRKTNTKVVTGEALVNGAFTASSETRNFSLVVNMSGVAPYSTAGQTLTLRIGALPTEVVFITSDNGNLALTFYDMDMYSYKYVVYDGTNGRPTIPIPTSQHLLVCELYDGLVRIYYPNTATTDQIPTAEQVIVSQALFNPQLGTYEANMSTGNVDALLEYAKGEHVLYKPSLNNREIWGGPDGSVGLKYPYGGNGVNHPSSIGAKAVYDATFDKSDLSVAGIEYKSGSTSSWAKCKDGFITEMGGTTEPVVGTRIDRDITWPVSLASQPSIKHFTASVGSPAETPSEDVRNTQHTVTYGYPSNTGVWLSVNCLNLPTAARYVSWRLDLS